MVPRNLLTKAFAFGAVFASGFALAVGGCGDDDGDGGATTRAPGENTATLAPGDTTTEQTVTETGLTGTTAETETEREEDDGGGSGSGDGY